jgi:hypothetical protein
MYRSLCHETTLPAWVIGASFDSSSAPCVTWNDSFSPTRSVMKAKAADATRFGAGFACILCLTFNPTAGDASSTAPSQLFGKSVVVGWSEARMQRRASEATFHAKNVSITESIYISTAGRPFERRAYPRSGIQRENVGASGLSSTGNAHVVQFQGQSILITTGHINGARRIQIDFDGNFLGCTAHVVNGKEAGAGAYTVRSLQNSNMPVEVEAVSTSAATCSIKDGNVFAD